jgi:3-deoxy-7-phosphoheptulonate synthase
MRTDDLRIRRVRPLLAPAILVGGRHSLDSDPLIYGQSVTDGCLGFDDTRRALVELASGVR